MTHILCILASYRNLFRDVTNSQYRNVIIILPSPLRLEILNTYVVHFNLKVFPILQIPDSCCLLGIKARVVDSPNITVW